MARGDISLDLNTNDLNIVNANNNFIGDSFIRLFQGREYIMSANVFGGTTSGDNGTWKLNRCAINKPSGIDSLVSSEDLTLPVSLQYGISTPNGGFQVGDRLSLLYEEVYGGSLILVNLDILNKIIQSMDSESRLTIKYRNDDGETPIFVLRVEKLGDFLVEDSIVQNEYILLNASEGSFLQSPIQGVGIKRYVQSPTSNNEIIQDIVNKFAEDSLRVLEADLDKSSGALRIVSEEKGVNV